MRLILALVARQHNGTRYDELAGRRALALRQKFDATACIGDATCLVAVRDAMYSSEMARRATSRR